MAKQKKEQIVTANTVFNVKPIHVARIKAYLDAGSDVVIIHGDGQMFAGKTANEGSDHHKEFNSGVAEINKDEAVARAKFRAVYKKGDELPVTSEEVIQEFYANQSKEMQQNTKPELKTGFENSVTIPDPVIKETKQ